MAKKKTEIRMAQCVCGCRKMTLYVMVNGRYIYECDKCGYTPFSGDTDDAAKKEWNKDMQIMRNRIKLGYSVPHVFKKQKNLGWN